MEVTDSSTGITARYGFSKEYGWRPMDMESYYAQQLMMHSEKITSDNLRAEMYDPISGERTNTTHFSSLSDDKHTAFSMLGIMRKPPRN